MKRIPVKLILRKQDFNSLLSWRMFENLEKGILMLILWKGEKIIDIFKYSSDRSAAMKAKNKSLTTRTSAF